MTVSFNRSRDRILSTAGGVFLKTVRFGPQGLSRSLTFALQCPSGSACVQPLQSEGGMSDGDLV